MVKYNKKHKIIQLSIYRENAVDIFRHKSLKQLMLVYPQSIIV